MNFFLFIASYCVAIMIVGLFANASKWSKDKRKKWVMTAAILCVPFNIGGDIYTIFGSSFNKNGDVYSVFSFAQKGRNVYSIFGSAYQEATTDAMTIIGLSMYQRAGGDAVTWIGVSAYQDAINEAVVVIGLSGYQKARRVASTIVGLSLYQEVGDRNRAITLFSILDLY